MRDYPRSILVVVLGCGVACSSRDPKPLTTPPPLGAGEAIGQWPDDDVRALIAQMTPSEKVAQLGNRAPEIPRLGIPAYDYWNECLHGVQTDGATSFPQAIALASTWDPVLVERVASAIADEARGHHVQHGKGLTYWAPVINMLRDPRWGRYEESYSEDPWLMARTGVAFVHGLQGRDPKYLKVVATPKHYAGNNSEFNRHNGSSEIDEQLMHEYYLPAFEATVREGGAFSVMSAYNRVNGIPASASPLLLKDILRGAWGFKGYVVSDCDAVWDIYGGHHWVDSLARAAGVALVAGTDLNCGSTYPRELENALAMGYVSQTDIDLALFRVLRARFLLGEFGPANDFPYGSIDPAVIESKAHADLALEAARSAIVLLKNRDGALPIDASGLRSIAVTGPHADTVTLGGYSGNPHHTVSLLSAIKARLADAPVNVRFQPGCDIGGSDVSGIAAAADVARASDVAVVVVGTTQDVLREELDRPDWSLPGVQGELIQAVFAANPRTVVVLVTAGPVAVDWAQANVPAILSAFYDGQEQGAAIADVLFGDFNPGGKLTTTWYAGDAILPPLDDYDLRKGRTYLYYKGQPLYPFGFGLSYTTFEYSRLTVADVAIGPAGNTTITVDITNAGAVAGDEVAELYVRDVEASVPRPLQELRGYRKIHLEPGETKTVVFPLSARDLAFWDASAHAWKVEEGAFDIAVGASSADIRLRGGITVSATPDRGLAVDAGGYGH